MKKIDYLISTFFGVGNIPVASGTFGTLAAAILYYLFVPETLYDNYRWGFAVILFLIIISFPLASSIKRVENKFGEDSGRIVIDEVIGYIVTMMFLPKTLFVIISGFILFRIFDILKPEPVNMSQKIKNGWGVLIDDILAGIYANIAIRIILRFI